MKHLHLRLGARCLPRRGRERINLIANADIAMSSFPKVRIGDDVVAQERLLREHFGVERLQLVTGGSMGAQQTYEWAVRFPDKVLRAAPMAGTAQNTPHDYLYVKALNEAITSDPGWADGEYKSNADVSAGLKRQAGIWAVMGSKQTGFVPNPSTSRNRRRHWALITGSAQWLLDPGRRLLWRETT